MDPIGSHSWHSISSIYIFKLDNYTTEFAQTGKKAASFDFIGVLFISCPSEFYLRRKVIKIRHSKSLFASVDFVKSKDWVDDIRTLVNSKSLRDFNKVQQSPQIRC